MQDLRTGGSSYPTTFACERLNPSTFLIVENDQYGEHPFIYAKIYQVPPLMVISDTGCGGGSNARGPFSDTLRTFLETQPISANENKPLNPRTLDGKTLLHYLIICTHCHYDHILGIPSFLAVAPVIVASSHRKSFIESDLPKHSLCHYLNVPTPEYVVSYWAGDMEQLIYERSPLGLQVLHTPGHTPDELAWYDEVERHLYVGDSFYERIARDKSYTQAIIFPTEGNIIEYMRSLEKMVEFVAQKNQEPGKAPLKVGCGHVTCSIDGRELLDTVQKYFWDIIGGSVPVKETMERRGEAHCLWQEEGEAVRFSLQAPRRLVDEAREHFHRGPSTARMQC